MAKTSDKAVPVISKRGNGDLRYALYQAAQIASYHNDGFRALYTRYLQGRERRARHQDQDAGETGRQDAGHRLVHDA